MARLIASMNLSLDGYVAALGKDEGSRLESDEEVHRAFNELGAEVPPLEGAGPVFCAPEESSGAASEQASAVVTR